MKKLILATAVASVAIACNNEANTTAANDSISVTANPVDTLPVAETFSDYKEGDIIRKDGKLVVYSNGTWVAVDKDIVLDNGVVIKKNGEIVDKHGRIIVLEDGERVTKAGVFFNRAGAAVEDAWDATKRGVTNAAEATGNALEKGYDATKEGVKEAADATKRGVEKAADATKEKAEDVGAAIKKGAQKVDDKAKKVKEDLKK